MHRINFASRDALTPCARALGMPSFDMAGLESDSTNQLQVSWLRHRTIPDSEVLAGRIVVKRNAVPKCLTVAGEVMVIEDVKRFAANFDVEPLFDRKRFR